jgi:predicted XRE-type DNA-binding protein
MWNTCVFNSQYLSFRTGRQATWSRQQLVSKIDAIMKKRRLKQVEAASVFGTRQPDVSRMLSGDFRQFSVERLLRFLVALDQDVKIVVKPHHDRKNAPALPVL